MFLCVCFWCIYILSVTYMDGDAAAWEIIIFFKLAWKASSSVKKVLYESYMTVNKAICAHSLLYYYYYVGLSSLNNPSWRQWLRLLDSLRCLKMVTLWDYIIFLWVIPQCNIRNFERNQKTFLVLFMFSLLQSTTCKLYGYIHDSCLSDRRSINFSLQPQFS